PSERNWGWPEQDSARYSARSAGGSSTALKKMLFTSSRCSSEAAPFSRCGDMGCTLAQMTGKSGLGMGPIASDRANTNTKHLRDLFFGESHEVSEFDNSALARVHFA